MILSLGWVHKTIGCVDKLLRKSCVGVFACMLLGCVGV